MYDTPDDVPESVKTNKRYANVAGYTIKEVAEQVRRRNRSGAPVAAVTETVWPPVGDS